MLLFVAVFIFIIISHLQYVCQHTCNVFRFLKNNKSIKRLSIANAPVSSLNGCTVVRITAVLFHFVRRILRIGIDFLIWSYYNTIRRGNHRTGFSRYIRAFGIDELSCLFFISFFTDERCYNIQRFCFCIWNGLNYIVRLVTYVLLIQNSISCLVSTINYVSICLSLTRRNNRVLIKYCISHFCNI